MIDLIWPGFSAESSADIRSHVDLVFPIGSRSILDFAIDPKFSLNLRSMFNIVPSLRPNIGSNI